MLHCTRCGKYQKQKPGDQAQCVPIKCKAGQIKLDNNEIPTAETKNDNDMCYQCPTGKLANHD